MSSLVSHKNFHFYNLCSVTSNHPKHFVPQMPSAYHGLYLQCIHLEFRSSYCNFFTTYPNVPFVLCTMVSVRPVFLPFHFLSLLESCTWYAHWFYDGDSGSSALVVCSWRRIFCFRLMFCFLTALLALFLILCHFLLVQSVHTCYSLTACKPHVPNLSWFLFLFLSLPLVSLEPVELPTLHVCGS